jgi:hypothetical protein
MQSLVIQRVQQQRFGAKLDEARESDKQAKEIIKEEKESVQRTYELNLAAVQKMREARESEGLGAKIGTALCPVVGTFIGHAAGSIAAQDSLDDKADLDRRAGHAEQAFSRAETAYNETHDSLVTARDDRDRSERFAQELRQRDHESAATMGVE